MNTDIEQAEEVMNLGLDNDEDEKRTADSKSSKADTAEGVEFNSNSFDKECNKELNKQHTNKVKEASTFLDKLWNEKAVALRL